MAVTVTRVTVMIGAEDESVQQLLDSLMVFDGLCLIGRRAWRIGRSNRPLARF
jgi:hypothetical protein